MLKLGLDTWLWASVFTKEHLFCIERVKELGGDIIDFSINDPDVFPVKEAAALVKEYGLEAVTSTALPLSCNPISPDRKERETALEFIKKLIDITAELGAGITAGVNYAASGYHTGLPRTGQELEWSVEYMKKAAAYARQCGILIAVEPVKRFESHLINTAKQALDYITLVGEPNIRVHLDTFHMNIEEADLPAAIEQCGDKLAHLHFPDSNRGVPGMGHIPWVRVLRSLHKMNYQGAACIETFNPETISETCSMTYLNRTFADTTEELAQKGLRYLRAAEVVAGIA